MLLEKKITAFYLAYILLETSMANSAIMQHSFLSSLRYLP